MAATPGPADDVRIEDHAGDDAEAEVAAVASEADTEQERQDILSMVPFPPRNLSRRIKRICLTGGPCGGKTTALSQVAHRLRSMGIQVFMVPENATAFSAGGAGFPVRGTAEQQLEWECAKISTQITMEDCFVRIAQASGRTSVIIFDRGCMDTKAYCSPEAWDAVKASLDVTEDQLCNRYDAVVHLVTAADGAEAYYTHQNNAARSETVDEARIVDGLTRAAWQGHPRHRIVPNPVGGGGMTAKTQAVVSEVCRLLGVSCPRQNRIRRLVDPAIIDQFATPQMARLKRFFDEFDVEMTFLESDSSQSLSFLRRCVHRGGARTDTDVYVLCQSSCHTTTPVLSCVDSRHHDGPPAPVIDLGPARTPSKPARVASPAGTASANSSFAHSETSPGAGILSPAAREGPHLSPLHRPQSHGTRSDGAGSRSPVSIEEHTLKRQEYHQLLDQADPCCKPLLFHRRCFLYRDHWYQLDHFPQAEGGLVYVDVEVHDVHEEVKFPGWLSGHVRAVIAETPLDFHLQTHHISRRLAEGQAPQLKCCDGLGGG
eukprot:TRINITY_DN3287_c1_g1_i2.p1 TRINITY_DN3287_c1_g1~~TRINITY_DN3287_c1_g1_i2.p1  ORF type:complete len:561 (+),score=110.39 TRINITY_DN3287_c1_g1_i2:53-1684(+)